MKHIVIGAGMQAFAEEGKKTQPFVSIDLTTMQQRVASPGESCSLKLSAVGRYLWLEHEMPSLSFTDTLIGVLVRRSIS